MGLRGFSVRKIMQVGKGVSLDILRASSVSDERVKSSEEQGPPGLSGIESPCQLEVGQILVMGEDGEGMQGPLQPVSPLFESEFNGE